MTSPLSSLTRIASRAVATSQRRSQSQQNLSPWPMISRKADPRAYPRQPYDPELKHEPVSEGLLGGTGDESNPHNIPPEGDQDHGRSGWGFQSRSRHEHFTFPGEEQYEYYPSQGWYDFWTPGWRRFWRLSLLFVVVYPNLPDYVPLVVPRGEDMTIRRTDTIAPQGPDDKRVLVMRMAEWWMAKPDDWRKTYWDKFGAEYSRMERNRAFFLTLGDQKVMPRGQAPMSNVEPDNVQYFPGDLVPGLTDEQTLTERDIALSVGVDTDFYKAQPPIIW